MASGRRTKKLAIPFWMAVIILLEISSAITMLVLTAYAASKLGSSVAGFGLTWFTFILTFIYFFYVGITLAAAPAAYYFGAAIPFEVFINIFWLISWAVLAYEATNITHFQNFYGPYPLMYMPSSYTTAFNCVKAAAGVGAFLWVLFCISLCFVIVASNSDPDPADYVGGASAGDAGVAAAREAKPTELQNYGSGSGNGDADADAAAANGTTGTTGVGTYAPAPDPAYPQQEQPAASPYGQQDSPYGQQNSPYGAKDRQPYPEEPFAEASTTGQQPQQQTSAYGDAKTQPPV